MSPTASEHCKIESCDAPYKEDIRVNKSRLWKVTFMNNSQQQELAITRKSTGDCVLKFCKHHNDDLFEIINDVKSAKGLPRGNQFLNGKQTSREH
jgi:hypothetical protein